MAAPVSAIYSFISHPAGATIIHSRADRLPHTLKIIEKEKESGVLSFSAFIPRKYGYAWIGELKFTWLRILPNGAFGSEKDGPIYSTCTINGPVEKTHHLSKVFIDELLSFEHETCIGVDSALMQVAVESSFRLGCEGRVRLVVTDNSHPFWYKMGIRSTQDCMKDRRVFREIAAAKREKRRPRTDDLNVNNLYLPAEAIARWKQRIDTTPILFKPT